jgi:transposase-like protein
VFVPGKVSFTETELRAAVASSRSYSEALRKLHLRAAGGNHRTIKKYVELWGVSTAHFDQDAIRRESLYKPPTPLGELLVEHSTYHRGHLKRRLFAEGIKAPRCELCGQDEIWRGERMALILDHINGIPDDNRLENLRIVCPNCAATFETHCGRKNRQAPTSRECPRCGKTFTPADRRQRYCSRYCGVRWDRTGVPRPGARKVAQRPSCEQLLAEVAATSWSAVGRKYGVSDNAIRKWVRDYERERATAGSVEPDGAAGGGVPGPVGLARPEVDASDPAVDRRAGRVAVEDGVALRRELVAPVGDDHERVQVGGECEDGRVAEPWRVFALSHSQEKLVRVGGLGSKRFEDLPLGAGEAAANVRKILQEALEGGDLEPRAGVG